MCLRANPMTEWGKGKENSTQGGEGGEEKASPGMIGTKRRTFKNVFM